MWINLKLGRQDLGRKYAWSGFESPLYTGTIIDSIDTYANCIYIYPLLFVAYQNKLTRSPGSKGWLFPWPDAKRCHCTTTWQLRQFLYERTTLRGNLFIFSLLFLLIRKIKSRNNFLNSTTHKPINRHLQAEQN